MIRLSAPALLVLATMLPLSASAAGLPGGATSLDETHGDWIVHCEVQADVVACAVRQQQLDRQSGQRVLGIELRPAQGGLQGTLMMPFGLALARGVSLRVDDAAPLPRLDFRTCLPAGCLVDIEFGPDVLAGLRSGTTLHVDASADGGAPTPFGVSLQGFAGAVDRAVELLR